ncbi:hypothetical protein L1987_36523 [Smallanthus sonchifolius]|uniref:Uncharacterized protein n=1 Tax=Smallanthus sonchifolius TaxID=185202 RepID=A0ACB9HF74_9ASTR|nr:hypothetical protein L1987_36523 [Smallanthus sonchifolius]
MNGPYIKNYSKQQPTRSSRSVPVQQTQQRSSPKVISVPVHFVSSDQPRTTMSMLKDSAALKIQKLFRGFVVRKSVRKIASIRNEVTAIERRIDAIEVVNLIRSDAKERLRVNETLMSLLFKLDSIRGVDSGIRDLRKSVTRKAIALQEKVDSIAQQTLHSPDHDSGEINLDNSACTSTSEEVKEASNSIDEIVNHHVNLEAMDDHEDSSVAKEVVKEVVTDTVPVKAMETIPAVNSIEFGGKDDTVRDVQKLKEGNCANYEKENIEILQNLVGDNEKMMRLMNKISERNEMQTRMINSLSRRVEQLEKALISRNKKRKHVSLRRRRDIDSFCI